MQTSFPREDIKVLLLEGVSRTALDSFATAGYSRVEYHERALPREELLAHIADAHIVGIRSRTQLDAEAVAAARRLLAVGCFCIGTNQVDLDATRERGVPVFNAPYSNTRSVAELVIAEAIMLMRRVPERNAECHRGAWSKSATGSYEVRGKTMGIVGYGHIGTQVGVLAESLGMRVLFHDIESKLALGNATAAADLGDLLERADIVTLHVPQTAATRGMIGAAELKRMRRGAVLINASRGDVVAIDALAAALSATQLAGAAVDVFPQEPKSTDEQFASPLRGMPNVILTPHVGGSTEEAQANIGLEVAAKLLRYSDNGSTLSAVNFPEVSLPEHPASRRLLHIHRNVPGMLSRINELFSSEAINVDAQYLQTDSRIGYVVIDVSAPAEQAEMLKEKMAAIPGTLRTRLLY
jgi:D-3-phosphoglycerate dehydrogenase